MEGAIYEAEKVDNNLKVESSLRVGYRSSSITVFLCIQYSMHANVMLFITQTSYICSFECAMKNSVYYTCTMGV